jgi:hypothetical protein
MAIISSSSSDFMPSSMVATIVNPIVYVSGMVVAHSALATSSSSGALGSCVEASLGRSVGASVDNECRSDPLLSIGNLGKASFSDIVKNVPHSPHPLVREALT